MSDRHWHEENGVWLYGEKKITCTKAAHLYCSKYCLLSAQQVRKCENRECPLWGFRDGHNVNRRNITIIKRNASSGVFLPTNKAGKSKPPDLSNEIIRIGNKKYKLIDLEDKK